MKVIEQSYEILTDISYKAIYELEEIEKIARTCYKSEDKYQDQAESAKKLIRALISKDHEAMLEHSMLTVKFICDRSTSHELVRHRMASFAQESQRYCNYAKDKFGSEITFIRPCYLNDDTRPYAIWRKAMKEAENAYFDLLDIGLMPQEARAVLPNSTKTEVVVSANYREWRHILRLRTAMDAHPQIRLLMRQLLADLQTRIPVIFDDIKY